MDTLDFEGFREPPESPRNNSTHVETLRMEVATPSVVPPSGKFDSLNASVLGTESSGPEQADSTRFFFTMTELAPEFSASAHATFSQRGIAMRPKTHSATLREQRRKAMRDKSAAVAGAVRHKQVMLPGNLRFSADCITYKVGPPAKGSGSFYVKPFTLAPSRRITRTQRKWAESGLLPNVKGGVRTERTKMLEKAKGARDVLNRTPLIVPQGILREARSFSVYKTIGETSKERFLPGEAVMLAKMKGGLLDFGPDYLSGTVTLGAPTWDMPIMPRHFSQISDLVSARAESYKARFYKTGELPPQSTATIISSVANDPFRPDGNMSRRRRQAERADADGVVDSFGTPPSLRPMSDSMEASLRNDGKVATSEILVLNRRENEGKDDDNECPRSNSWVEGHERSCVGPPSSTTLLASTTNEFSHRGRAGTDHLEAQPFLPQSFLATPPEKSGVCGHTAETVVNVNNRAPGACGAEDAASANDVASFVLSVDGKTDDGGVVWAPSMGELGGQSLFAASLSEAADLHIAQHEWHETLSRRGDIKSETHSDVMRALRGYRKSSVPSFVPLHMRHEYTTNPARELMLTPGTPQYHRRQEEIAERQARMSPGGGTSASKKRGGSVRKAKQERHVFGTHAALSELREGSGGGGSGGRSNHDTRIVRLKMDAANAESATARKDLATTSPGGGSDTLEDNFSVSAPLAMDPSKPGSAGGIWRNARGQPTPPTTTTVDDEQSIAIDRCYETTTEPQALESPDSSPTARLEQATNSAKNWQLPKPLRSIAQQTMDSNKGITPLIAGRRDYKSGSLVRKLLPGEELLHVTSRTGLFPAFKAKDEAEKFERLKAQAHSAAASVASGGSADVKLPGRAQPVFAPVDGCVGGHGKISGGNPVGYLRRHAQLHPQLAAKRLAVQVGITDAGIAAMSRPERASYLRLAGHERRGHVHKPIPITEGFKRELIKLVYLRASREVGSTQEGSEVSSMASSRIEA